MAAQTQLLSLRTALTALIIAGVVFLSGNLVMYLVLYPPAAPPATMPAPAEVIAPTDDGETRFTGMSGDWIRENGLITQRALDRLDYLTASGIQGTRYLVSVEITLPTAQDVPEAGGGLVFHMPQRDSFAGSQMVRFHQNGLELLWGWYDESGIFQYEGGQPLPVSDSQTRLLTLVVRADRYDIRVDDAPVVSDLPLRNSSGYIGLMSYRGGVSFADFRLVIGAES